MSQHLPIKRYGHLIYFTNPSLDETIPRKIKTVNSSKLGKALVIAPESGEVITQGAFGFMEEKEVDTEQFVKIYLAGIRKYAELTKSGSLLFEFIYEQLSGTKGKDQDKIGINFYLVNQWRPKIMQRTYERGMRELIDKEFVFHSVIADMYFINVRYLFNGDRIVLAQSYTRKNVTKSSRKKLG